MTQPRSKIVDPGLTRWYHGISRCVRRAFLFAENHEFDRKDWLTGRLKELDAIFAVSVAGFSLMDNHLHLLVRIYPDVAQAWARVHREGFYKRAQLFQKGTRADSGCHNHSYRPSMQAFQ